MTTNNNLYYTLVMVDNVNSDDLYREKNEGKLTEYKIYDKSDLGVSAPSMCNAHRCSFIRQNFTICFDLNGHLQVRDCCISGL
jgi:hypothetical protein